jgi:hypothetical protein
MTMVTCMSGRKYLLPDSRVKTIVRFQNESGEIVDRLGPPDADATQWVFEETKHTGQSKRIGS